MPPAGWRKPKELLSAKARSRKQRHTRNVQRGTLEDDIRLIKNKYYNRTKRYKEKHPHDFHQVEVSNERKCAVAIAELKARSNGPTIQQVAAASGAAKEPAPPVASQKRDKRGRFAKDADSLIGVAEVRSAEMEEDEDENAVMRNLTWLDEIYVPGSDASMDGVTVASPTTTTGTTEELSQVYALDSLDSDDTCTSSEGSMDTIAAEPLLVDDDGFLTELGWTGWEFMLQN